MSEGERKEIEAFFAFLSTFDLARPISTATDLSDGAALFQVLALVYVVPISCLQYLYQSLI